MQEIILNVTPGGIGPTVYVNQYDMGREIAIRFKEDVRDYSFPGSVTFKINGRKPDNHVFEYTEADTWDGVHPVLEQYRSGSIMWVTLATTEQMTAAAGKVDVQLTFKGSETQNDAVLGTLNFTMMVQERPGVAGDPSESDVPDVVRSVCDVPADADGDVNLKWADMSSINNLAIAEATRTMTAQRVKGSYVFVKTDDQLYEITSTINANETLTPGTNATARSVGDVLRALTSDLASVVIRQRISNYTGSEEIFSAAAGVYQFTPTSTGLPTEFANYGYAQTLISRSGAVTLIQGIMYDANSTKWAEVFGFANSVTKNGYWIITA